MATQQKSARKPESAKESKGANGDRAAEVIGTIESAEQATIDAVRTFVESVDRALPDISDDSPRKKIIDSAFTMVERLVGTSNDLARNVVKVAGDAMDTAGKSVPGSKG